MIKKIATFFLFLVLFSSAFTFLESGSFVVNVQAQSYGLDETANQVDAFKSQTGQNIDTSNFLQTQSGKIIGFVLSFVGILFLGLTIFAGLKWMLAQGNQQKVDDAKSLLVNAVIGLVIVFAAYAITVFVGEFVSSGMFN